MTSTTSKFFWGLKNQVFFNLFLLKNKRKNYLLLCLLLVVVLINNNFAQSTTELLSPAPSGGPSGNGPSTANQTVTFYTNSTTPYSPTLTATYSLSNQQFGSIEGNPSIPGTIFGGNTFYSNNGTANDNIAIGAPLYGLMNSFGGNTATSINPYYTACKTCTAGTGIDIASNYSVALYNSSDALINSQGATNYALNSRVQFADLTITFNRPVTNPVVHFSGLGGFFSYYTDINGVFTNYTIGFTTDVDLITSGLTWTKLSGNSVMNVNSTQISNTATRLGSFLLGANLNNISRQAAGGSVVVNGTNITTFTMRLYLRGDGGIITDNGGTVVSANNGNAVQWSSQLNHTFLGTSNIGNGVNGDALMVGLSLDCTPPSITAQPSNVSVCSGTSGDFTVAATGSPISYQWQSSSNNGTSWSNATETGNTTATLTTTNANLLYRVVVSNSCGTVTSNSVRLTTAPNVSISTQPVGFSECLGGTQSLSVTATGGYTPLTYQWSESTDNGTTWSPISGATGSTYTPLSNSVSTKQFRVVVSSSGGVGCTAATSNAVSVSILNDPSISVSTAAASTVCPGAAINLTATPTLTAGSCNIQWQSSPNGTTWTDIGGATAANLSITSSATTRYRATLVACSASGYCILYRKWFSDSF